MRDKILRQEPGEKRDDTCDHGLSGSCEKLDVCEKIKYNKVTCQMLILGGVRTRHGAIMHSCITLPRIFFAVGEVHSSSQNLR